MKTPLPNARPRGIALVITLIMLSVTLIMAVAFLAVSNRERGSVATVTDAAHARQAADSALAQAEGQIISTMKAANPAVFSLGPLVSTNYINQYGFVPGTPAIPKVLAVFTSPTNVNYNYTFNGAPYNNADLVQNIANLFYLPRAPVFVPVNGGHDFRYYLDLNRNGQFDDSGVVPNTTYTGGVYTTNGTVSEFGDPQWIGVLEHPDRPHAPDNRFIARYAFIAVPVGNTLDINAIYNDALAPDEFMRPANKDGFLRNEGVGSWELNLAAFLADLNTNEWDNPISPYNYQTPYNNLNTGAAFDDALSLLAYRYNFDVNNQWSANQLFGNLNALQYSAIDNYSVGSLMTTPRLPVPMGVYSKPWAGSPNTNHFFSPADFFDRTKTEATVAPGGFGFTDRLLQAGTNTMGNPNLSQVPTYNRYTFYSLLQQLGTDTTPDNGKMNLNYKNIINGVVVPGMETNFIPWTALDFFTNAASRLLGAYTTNWYAINPNYVDTNGNVYLHYYFTNTFGTYNGPYGPTNGGPFGVFNIPVLVGGQFVYTPAVHRLLQLAANMYDATTNAYVTYGSGPPVAYPSVFRPTFAHDSYGNVFINGYTNVDSVTGLNDSRLSSPVNATALDLGLTTLDLNNVNVYGVPWIFGAKKGLPSFNELYDLNSAQVTRLLQVNRFSTNIFTSGNFTTNEMFVVAITNTVGMSFWNSYYNTYTGSGNITVFMQDNMSLVLTNAANPAPASPYIYTYGYTNTLASWPGSRWDFRSAPPSVGSVNPYSFQAATWNFTFLPPSAYMSASGNFVPLPAVPPPASFWETNVTSNYPFPQTALMSTNWVQAYILDGPSGNMHIIDYVHFSGPNSTRNLTAELADPNYVGPPQFRYNWSTNVAGYGPASTVTAPTYGEVNQLGISRGLTGFGPPPGGAWTTTAAFGGNDGSPAAQQAFFNGLYTPTWQYNGKTYANLQYLVQAPYTPTRTMYDYTLWQANDPLVHYLATDLNYVGGSTTGLQKSDYYPPVLNINNGLNLYQVGSRYQPWGQQGQLAQLTGVDTNAYNLAYKDPLVWGSDFWGFPTNKFPTIGWLGAVHRGTPWQTVYLKSTDLIPETVTNARYTQYLGTNTWQVWSGNAGNVFDAVNASPVQDRLLFDLFTTGPDENATLGKLSVNQPHLAAWSAALSGLVVYTNFNTNVVDATIMTPAGLNGLNFVPGDSDTYLAGLWNSIQQTRTTMPGQVFQHVGDVLASPALSAGSPFLPVNNLVQARTGISDAMYEWIPRQTMSLLTLGAPRYVIYCYGQALKPAPNGIVTSGPYALLCTNYQIVSETAQRAVLQVQLSNNVPTRLVLKNLNPLPPDQ